MRVSFFGRHKCPKCKKRFRKYKEGRRQELIDKQNGKYQIIWQNVCPHCDCVLNEGNLITSNSSSISELMKKNNSKNGRVK